MKRYKNGDCHAHKRAFARKDRLWRGDCHKRIAGTTEEEIPTSPLAPLNDCMDLSPTA